MGGRKKGLGASYTCPDLTHQEKGLSGVQEFPISATGSK